MTELETALFIRDCPECGKRKARTASVYVYYTEHWVHSFVIDCDQTEDHMVLIEGAWTNPIVKENLARFGLNRKLILKNTVATHKMSNTPLPFPKKSSPILTLLR